jgi:hypothetical protein
VIQVLQVGIQRLADLWVSHRPALVAHFNVSANPTAVRTAPQVVDAFPWQDLPK